MQANCHETMLRSLPQNKIGTSALDRDSPDDSRTVLDIRDFRGLLQGRREVRTAIVISGSPDDGRGADLAIFAGIWTHSSHRLLLSA